MSGLPELRGMPRSCSLPAAWHRRIPGRYTGVGDRLVERILARGGASDDRTTPKPSPNQTEFIEELLRPVRAHPASLHEQVDPDPHPCRRAARTHCRGLQRAGDIFREATTFRGGPGRPGPVSGRLRWRRSSARPGGLADDNTVRFSHRS